MTIQGCDSEPGVVERADRPDPLANTFVSTARAARTVGVDEATIRKWRARGYIEPVAQLRDGRALVSWWRLSDVLACARDRKSAGELAAIADAWDEAEPEALEG